MIKNLLLFSLRNRWLIVGLSIAVMAIGYYSFTHLKIEAYPDIADTNVIIVAQHHGRAAEEVEQQVTIPIERAIQNTPNVLDSRSRTIFGLSVVQLTFQDGTDDYFARQQVMERLAVVDLPEGVVPELAPLSTAVGEIFRYVVEAPPEYSPTEIRDLQDWVIAPYLLQTSGIAEVTPFGGPLKQYHILVNPNLLRKYELSISDLEEAVEANNQNTGGNIINRGGQGFAVRGLGAIRDVEDIENIVLKSDGGVAIYISDVASVEIGPPPPSGVLGYTISDENIDVNNGVEGIILLRKYENPSEVLAELKERIKELEEHELPEGIKVKPLYDRSFLIDHSLETVGTTLFEGVSIVVIILVLLLGSIRSSLVVAITIPFSLLFAFIIMQFTGIPANLLSLGAIDFGIIVDGAVVMAEHLIRTYKTASAEERRNGIIHLTLSSAQEVGREIFFSVTIIILAYLPILLMSRVEGKLFSPMALTLAFAVIGSMVAALTFIPVLISFVYGKNISNPDKPIKVRESKIFKFIENGYTKILNRFIKHYKITVLLGFGIVLVLISLGLRLGMEFIPELDEGSIFLQANFPVGITIEENAKNAPKMREIISSFPQVKNVITQTGRNDDGTDPFPANRNEILIGLKDYHLWSDTISKGDLIQQIMTDLRAEFPAVSFASGQPIIDQVMEIVTGSPAELAISVIGNDLVFMREKADRIAEFVKEMEGSEDVSLEQEGTQAQLTINIDRKKAARYGVNIADVQNMIEVAIGGKDVSVLYDGTKRYDIILRFLPEYRSNIDEIKNILIPTSDESLIPIEQIANVGFEEGQTNIYRYNNKRMVTVRTDIVGRDQGSFVKELQEKIEQEIELPKGYEIIYGGNYENLERAGKQLAFTIPLTLVVVFIFIFMLFKNAKHTLITMSCVLFALAGGVSALLLRGYYFNVSAGVGFVSIFGISVMAGILLVSAINRESFNQPLNPALISKTSKGQLKAVITILILAIFGLIPAATSTGIGSDVQRPLATVIIGGLTSTLLFTPFLIPSLYWWANKNGKKKPHNLT